jgi:hypothetical protein
MEMGDTSGLKKGIRQDVREGDGPGTAHHKKNV